MTKLKTILNEKNKKMKKADYIILGIIVTLYSIVSLINLGSLKNPQTFLKFKYNEEVVFEFQQESDIGRMMFYTGRGISEYYLYTSIDGKEFNYIQNVYGEKTYSWSDINVYQRAKYIKLKATNNRYEMGEIAFYNTKNKQIIPQKITTTNKENTKNKKNLCDEKDSVPKKVNYLNSTYFDEIYFARSAYEYTKGEKVYEWTHPPLGKLIQAIPIKLSGKMTTFNYRLMGNLAGITMIIVMYLFGKLLFEKRKYAVFSSLLMSLDTFHFAHTRMGTVDSFLVLFIMLSYYYMAKFLSDSKNHKNLFLSGLFFGLSITVKWTGFYAGLGLAIIFFTKMIDDEQTPL